MQEETIQVALYSAESVSNFPTHVPLYTHQACYKTNKTPSLHFLESAEIDMTLAVLLLQSPFKRAVLKRTPHHMQLSSFTAHIMDCQYKLAWAQSEHELWSVFHKHVNISELSKCR